MINKFIALIKLFRPINCLSASIGVLIGGFINSRVGNANLWLAAIIAGLITASGNVINDYFDIDIDMINKPDRILPSGKFPLKPALWIGISLSVFATLLGFFLGWKMGGIALLMSILAFLYSWQFKKTFLWGNIIVSMMTALTFFYGGLVFNKIGHAWVPALIVLMFMLAREILKTVEDIRGDKIGGAQTIAILRGQSRALHAFIVFAIITALIAPLPWIIHDVSIIYLFLSVPFVSAALIFVIFLIISQPSDTVIKRSLLITKGSWIIWAIAMCLGLLLR